MNIPLLDLRRQYASLQAELDEAVLAALAGGNYVLGPAVAALEEEIALHVGTMYAVALASGTDALTLALRAFGVGRGDEVIVPAYTFFASAEAVLHAGATPVLVDIEPDTFCIDVEAAASSVTPRTKAIMPVHLFGHPAQMHSLSKLAADANLLVIEDNAQAFGASFGGRLTGSFGDAGCLSFFPSKNLGACGDGGMVVTNHSDAADAVKMLRTHGWKKKYQPVMVGYNSRLDEIQAALLRVKLRHVDEWNRQRRRIAMEYAHRLDGVEVRLPREASGALHVYHLYVIETTSRDALQRHLRDRGIATAVYYPIPLHLTEALREFGWKAGQFPVSERASKQTLALPMFPGMQEGEIEAVATGVREFFA